MRASELVTAAILALVAVACGDSSSGAGEPSSAPPAASAAPEAGAPAIDAATPPSSGDAGAKADTTTPSRCTVDKTGIACDHKTTTVGGRTVTYATPAGPAPAAGWPTVIYFHGSFVAGDEAFSAAPDTKFGLYQLTSTIKALLDRGYAVVAPNAVAGAVWQSNVPPASLLWSGSTDDVFMNALFGAMSAGSFGALDAMHLYAMGISSGGFMTSRMAVSYAGKLRALAVHSGSYATCSTLCNVPTPLPADHPPTLFLRGETDPLVPASSVKPYLDALVAEGFAAKLVTDPAAGHEWLALAVKAIPDWFDAHR